MHQRLYPLLLLFCLVLISCKEKRTKKVRLQLPITIRTGSYGPFYSRLYGSVTDKRPTGSGWDGVYLSVRGIPKYLSNTAKDCIWFNSYQFVYQNVKEGRIDRDFYLFLQDAWKWQPDTTMLSGKPIRCYVYVVKGYDERVNKWAVMVDTNYNLDFSDEQVYYPVPIVYGKPDAVNARPVILQSDTYRNSHRYTVQTPVEFRMSGNDMFYNFPQHGVAILEGSNKKRTELFISSGFTRPNFLEHADIGTAETPLAYGKFDYKKLSAIGEAIEIDGILYKNNGVDQRTNTLQLESINADELRYSTKEGGLFYPFSGNDFVTNKPVSLQAYKGKYVYVDFWGIGCKPCIEAMPKLNQLYDSLNKNKVEFVGIVNDSPEQLKRFLTKRKLTWPQIIADSTNKLIETYGITGYPTTMLIDPDGKVAIKDVHLIELQAKLHKLNLYK